MKTVDLLKGEIGLELALDSGNWVLKAGYGYSPVQMLVASIGACGGYVLGSVLEKSHIDFELKAVHIDYEEDLEQKSKPLSKVMIEFIGSAPVSEHEKAQRALRLVSEYCPVMQSLDPKIEVIKTIRFE